MWVFLHSGHNHSESAAAAQSSSAVGPELLVLVAVGLILVSLVGFYVTKQYL